MSWESHEHPQSFARQVLSLDVFASEGHLKLKRRSLQKDRERFEDLAMRWHHNSTVRRAGNLSGATLTIYRYIAGS